MRARRSHFLVSSVIAALTIAAPGLATPAGGHGRIAVRSPAGASRGTILPDDESRLLAMVNSVRQSRGRLSPLIMDPALRSTARRHSQDMALRGYVGHGSFDARSLRDRFGLIARPRTRLGENVASAQTVEQGHLAFVASPGHLRNILDPTFHRVGIGVATARPAEIRITEDFAE